MRHRSARRRGEHELAGGPLATADRVRASKGEGGLKAALYKGFDEAGLKTRGHVAYLAIGSGRIWNFATLPLVPLPPSMCQTKWVP